MTRPTPSTRSADVPDVAEDRGAVVAVVLAAGEGRRFGGAKQLAPFRGRPVLAHAVDAVLGCPAIDEVVVVLGARADEIRAGVDLSRTRSVVNADWATGTTGSLRTGLHAARAAGAEAVVITLGDQPLLTPAAVEAVLASPGPAARAVREGRPGHPVVVRGELIGRLAATRDDGERRALLSATAVPVEVDAGPDVDTRDDLERLERLGRGPAAGA